MVNRRLHEQQCGLETQDPTGALVAFLQSAGSPCEASQSAAQLVGREAELCKLEWLDEERAEAIFEPMPLTSQRHDFDPLLSAVDALNALAHGYAKWNPPTSELSAASTSTDFCDLLVHRQNSSSGSSGGASAAAASAAAGNKSGLAMPSKKKIELTKSAAVGEGIACSILARSVELSQLLPFFSEHLASVSTGILQLLAKLMALPGGIKAMVHLSKHAISAGADRGSTSPHASFDGDLTPSSAFSEWPLAVEETERTEFASLTRPLLFVLQSMDSTFAEIEAAIDALDLLTGADASSESVVYNAVVPASATSTVDVPITQGSVFMNTLANRGVLVELLAYTDDCRLSDFPSDAGRRQAFVEKTRALALRLITLGSSLQDVALVKMDVLESSAEATDAPVSRASPRIEFVTRWAKDVLDMRVDVARFEYTGYPALVLAAELGDIAAARSLLSSGASPDRSSIDGTTPLMLALLTGNEELALELLQLNANADAMTLDGCDLCAWSCALASPLGQNMHATITRSYESICGAPNMELLVQLDSLDGSPALLDKLLDANVDASVSNASGDFLLHAVVSKLLVRRKIRGLDVCVRYHSHRVDEQSVLATVTKLVETHAVDVNACNLLGQTALHLALLFGHTAIVMSLLLHGANPNVQDAYGYLPLHYACLGLCGSDGRAEDEAIEVVRALLSAATRFELRAGEHVDVRKHKLPHEKNALAIDAILDAGYTETTTPKALTTKLACVDEVLSSRGFLDGLLPWHLACGGCDLVTATLCLDDDIHARIHSNGAARARLLTLVRDTFAVDLSLTASKKMTPLHFALKKDVGGSNTAVIDVLLATPRCRAQLNAIHETTTIDILPPIPDGTQVDVLTADLHAIHCYASSRSFDAKYHVILPNGTHLGDLSRDQLQPSEHGIATPPPAAVAAERSGHPKYVHLAESAFSPLHYAVQNNDALSLRLLALDDISTSPEGSDLPLLVLACVARRSPQVVAKLINQQANVRVHLPLLGAPRDVIANQIATCNLAIRKHAAALHYAVLYEDVDVVRTLVTNDEYTNVNVRRSGDGFTPLHLACEMSHMALVKVLLDHGANLLQMSTLSSTVGGVTPLHLLMKNDSGENERLKALVADKYLRPEMLLESLGGGTSPNDDDSEPLESACVLLVAEEHNVELYTRVHQLRESRREGQALSRRAIQDLEKSDDALEVFFRLFSDDSAADASGDVVAAFEALGHRHECFRRKIVRSRWITPRPPAAARRASNLAASPTSDGVPVDPTGTGAVS